MQLKNSALFHQQCYINGQWVAANNKDTLKISNSCQ